MRETLTTALDLMFGHERGYVKNPKIQAVPQSAASHTGHWRQFGVLPVLHLRRSKL